MIFNSEDNISLINQSTRTMLARTLPQIPVDTYDEEKFACLVSQLNAALKQYETDFRFFKTKRREAQIEALRRALEYCLRVSAMSPKEKYHYLSDLLYTLIAKIEASAPKSYLLYCFEQKGLYKTLYETRTAQGIIDANLQSLVNVGFERVLVSFGFVILFGVMGSMSMPIVFTALLNGAFAGAYMYLNGVIEGLYTQRRAARNSLPSLILGYDSGHYSVMKSNKRLPQAIAWGMIESTERAYFAGVVFFLAVMILTFFCPVSLWVLPLMTVMTPIMSKLIAISVTTPYQKALTLYTSPYQQESQAAMNLTLDENTAWAVNLKRKRIAHKAFVMTMFIGLGGLVSSSLLSTHLPVMFGTLLFNAVLPITCIIPLTLLVVASGIYLYQKKNEQTNNRFKLSFEPKEIIEIHAITDQEQTLIQGFDDIENERPRTFIEHEPTRDVRAVPAQQDGDSFSLSPS